MPYIVTTVLLCLCSFILGMAFAENRVRNAIIKRLHQ